MSRLDEMKGQMKQGVGTLTGDDDMRHEGQAEAEAAKLERETEGAADKGVGKAQETAGSMTDDRETELKGKARQAEGDIERTG